MMSVWKEKNKTKSYQRKNTVQEYVNYENPLNQSIMLED